VIIPAAEGGHPDESPKEEDDDEVKCSCLCLRRQRLDPNSPFEVRRKEYPIEYFIINLMKMKRTNVAVMEEKNNKELQ
jgi:hypothetical protein